MTPSESKYNVEFSTGSNFFDRKTMNFFGDTMANYGCCSYKEYWELWRKKPVRGGFQDSAFFCKETFKRVLNVR